MLHLIMKIHFYIAHFANEPANKQLRSTQLNDFSTILDSCNADRRNIFTSVTRIYTTAETLITYQPLRNAAGFRNAENGAAISYIFIPLSVWRNSIQFNTLIRNILKSLNFSILDIKWRKSCATYKGDKYSEGNMDRLNLKSVPKEFLEKKDRGLKSFRKYH